MQTVGRFAPSPTGTLHVGNLRTAVASWLSAKAQGGRWMLRIEDVDRARSRSHFVEEHIRDLAELGMESDGPILVQSQREASYQQALEELCSLGLLYPCACSRKDLAAMTSAPHESDGLRPYPGTCRERRLERLEPQALRFRLASGRVSWEDRLRGPQQDDPQQLTGDPLLHRRDKCFAYHLAVVVDDGEQGITEIVRGADLQAVTATQIRLQQALGWPQPLYAHLGLVVGPDGSRLGKRNEAVGIRSLESRGVRIPEILGWLGWSLGCLDRPEACHLTDLVGRFQWHCVPPGELSIPFAWTQ